MEIQIYATRLILNLRREWISSHFLSTFYALHVADISSLNSKISHDLNHGDVIYLHWNTSAQLEVMHTAQNCKQNGEANFYFQVQTLTWWIIADLRNQHIKRLDRALLTGALICVKMRTELFSPVSTGRRGEWRKKEDWTKLKTRTREKKSLLLQQRMKTANFVWNFTSMQNALATAL